LQLLHISVEPHTRKRCSDGLTVTT